MLIEQGAELIWNDDLQRHETYYQIIQRIIGDDIGWQNPAMAMVKLNARCKKYKALPSQILAEDQSLLDDLDQVDLLYTYKRLQLRVAAGQQGAVNFADL